MTKRIICLLLALIFCVQLAPMAARAAQEPKAHPFSFTGHLLKDEDVEGTCYYSDDYFAGDSSVYDPQLATMSLCFSYTTWPRSDASGAKWLDETGTVNAATNSKAQNAYDLLITELGFENFRLNDFWKAAPTEDSIGAVAASKKLSGATLIALGVRGGGYGKEWASNFTVGLTGDHQGFSEGADHVLSFLRSYIAEQKITGPVKLWLVGYSRGGCVANLVAGRLNQGFDLGVTLADLYAYTFEAPQGALLESLQGDHSNIHNVRNAADLLPLMAPESWGFGNYNLDRILPTAATSRDYADRLEQVLEFYNDFENADDHPYAVATLGTHFELKYDWSRLSPEGIPAVEIVTASVPAETVLAEVCGFLFDDVMGGRTTYALAFQDSFRELFATLLGGTGSLPTAGMSAGDFLLQFLGNFTAETLVELTAPMAAVNQLSLEERMAQVQGNLKAFVAAELKNAGLFGTILAMTGLDATLTDTLWMALSATLEDLYHHDPSSLQAMANAFVLMGDGFQAHWPELTLSWMMSQDSNYGASFTNSDSQTTRMVHINGPVTVQVYEGGKEISGLLSYTHEDGEQVLFLPGDGSYTLKLTATGAGQLHYAVDELDWATQALLRTVSFAPQTLSKGDSLTGAAPAMPDAVYTLTGSSVQETVTEQHTVTLTCQDPLSSLRGGGVYSHGSFASVHADVAPGATFLGWYDAGGKRLSTDADYRFAVTADTHLTAKFTLTQTHSLTVQAGTGGTVANLPMELRAGTTVALLAIPNEGYAFSGWTATDGAVADSKAAATTFTMGSKDAVVTASFKALDHSDCPSAHLKDVQKDAWYHEAIDYCVENGLMNGMTATTFGVDLDTTRCQVVTMLWRQAGQPKVSKTLPFTDVPKDAYYLDALKWAYANGVINGTTATTFGPDETLQREQLTAILYRYADSVLKLDVSHRADLRGYPDLSEVSDYAMEATSWAVARGLINGVLKGEVSYLSPKTAATRAQIATIMMRYCEGVLK